MLELKKGVRIDGVRPEIVIGMMVAAAIWKDLGHRLVITSVKDGEHSETSLHNSGNAFDCRTKYFTQEETEVAAERLRRQLGPDFDVIIEKTHIHVEYQPKTST